MPMELLRNIRPTMLCLLAFFALELGEMAFAQQASETKTEKIAKLEADPSFASQVQPLLQKYCLSCHNADTMKSGIRLDQLDGTLQDKHLFLWKDVLKQIDEAAMPPESETQPTADEREYLSSWIRQAMNTAKSRNTQKNGSVRRLTVSQYRNSMRDLLGLQENLSDLLPPDGVSREGFANNGQVLGLSPLQMEYYFDIAEQSLDLCIVDEISKPVIQNFRMDLGEAINPNPCPDSLILGANSLLLRNQDFVVTELSPAKPFDYTPFAMQTSWNFIEGYVGNDTIREWRKFDSIYHSVFACMRGTEGYPLGEPWQVVPDGLLLRPAIPSPEIFGESNTYGPMANFKISLRELPDHGDFRVTVRASRYDDVMLLDSASPMTTEPALPSIVVVNLTESLEAAGRIEQPGIYQVDVECEMQDSSDMLRFSLAGRQVSTQIRQTTDAASNAAASPVEKKALMLVRLESGSFNIRVSPDGKTKLHRLILGKLDDGSDLARRFVAFESRAPLVGVHLGLRRDCGSTLNPVGEPQPVRTSEPETYVFQGAINDFPYPSVEKDNVNYLAGVREIGVRCEFTDGRPMPRLQIHSVEFEGPIYSSWPPATHRNIFIDSPNQDDKPTYAREIIRSFTTRAWRRPITESEEELLFRVWENSFGATASFRQSVRDVLMVVLTSPQFLFLIENSASPEPEDLDAWELASKLSYFLWNMPPDQELLQVAAKNDVHAALDVQTDRMLADPRLDLFLHEFTSQWLSLDKLDVVEVDRQRYPHLTRDAKTHLRQEPVRFLRYLIDQNLPLRNLVQSDFIVANDVVASYYDLAGLTDSGFRFAAVQHGNPDLGGVLSQAGILAGLSDGRESNPIKRGAWLARKIIAEPPDDPPPNVPQLMEEQTQLTLRERLERHRNQEGCVKCHSGIDPWGVPFELYDAGGRMKKQPVDARSTLPDGTEVADLNQLKSYLANDRIDQVAFSFLKHLSCYANGRSLTYNELEWLREEGKTLKANDYRMQDMIRFVIRSDLFLKK